MNLEMVARCTHTFRNEFHPRRAGHLVGLRAKERDPLTDTLDHNAVARTIAR